MKKYFILVLSLFFITACSTREYYKPSSNIDKPIILKNKINGNILFFNKDIATLDNYKTIPYNTQLPKGFLAITKDIAKKGNVLLVDGKKIKFNSLIVTAIKKDNLLAIIFGDNHFELYDLNQNQTIASESFGEFLAARKFVAAPYFYKQLLLIPTLNGKLVIFDLNNYKVVRSLVVSQKDYFNNIIYLNVVNDSLIVASRDNIIVITPGLVINKNYNIKHILVDGEYIYIFTTEGKIIKTNLLLKPIKEKEFRFANIVEPIFFNNKIYFLNRGYRTYLINIDKDLNNYSVRGIKIIQKDECLNDYVNLQQNVFGYNGIYYIGNYILKLK